MTDRPIVERGAVIEDRRQQLGVEVGIDRHARLGGEVVEPGLALDHDQRAMP